MEIPIGIGHFREEILDRGWLASLPQRPDFRPMPDNLGERGKPALGMVRGTLAAHFPKVRRDGATLELSPVRPPALPKIAQIGASRLIEIGEGAGGQETADAKEKGLGVSAAEQLEGEPLREEGKGQLVALVTQRGRERLIERLIGAMAF